MPTSSIKGLYPESDSIVDDLRHGHFQIVAEHQSTTLQREWSNMFVVCSTVNGRIPHETDWVLTFWDSRESYENGIHAGILGEYDSMDDVWSWELLCERVGKHIMRDL